MSRPDWVCCLRSTTPKTPCGQWQANLWLFQSIEHVTTNRRQDGQLVCCPACLRAIRRADLADVEQGIIDGEVVNG